jgi:hypothetical protein
MVTILFSIEIERRLLKYDICNPVHIFISLYLIMDL